MKDGLPEDALSVGVSQVGEEPSCTDWLNALDRDSEVNSRVDITSNVKEESN